MQLEIERKLRALLTKEKEKAEVGGQGGGPALSIGSSSPLNLQPAGEGLVHRFEQPRPQLAAGGSGAGHGPVHGRLHAAMSATRSRPTYLRLQHCYLQVLLYM
jgi:hypothetical protein